MLRGCVKKPDEHTGNARQYGRHKKQGKKQQGKAHKGHEGQSEVGYLRKGAAISDSAALIGGIRAFQGARF